MIQINLKTKNQSAKAFAPLRSEKGMATIETVSLLIIFVIMMSYTFGSFGMIHTGILNSIAARTYAFETMRNRSNVIYFRDIPGGTFAHFQRYGNRIHSIRAESDNSSTALFTPTERAMQMGLGGTATLNREADYHMEKIPTITDGKRNSQVEVNPAWIITQYGICLNAKCQ